MVGSSEEASGFTSERQNDYFWNYKEKLIGKRKETLINLKSDAGSSKKYESL
jgi:hypothetical protein